MIRSTGKREHPKLDIGLSRDPRYLNGVNPGDVITIGYEIEIPASEVYDAEYVNLEQCYVRSCSGGSSERFPIALTENGFDLSNCGVLPEELMLDDSILSASWGPLTPGDRCEIKAEVVFGEGVPSGQSPCMRCTTSWAGFVLIPGY